MPFNLDAEGGPSAPIDDVLASEGRLRAAVEADLAMDKGSGEVLYPESRLGIRGRCALIGFGWAISVLDADLGGRTKGMTGALLPTSGSFFVVSLGAFGVPTGDEVASLVDVFLRKLNMMGDVRASA